MWEAEFRYTVFEESTDLNIQSPCQAGDEFNMFEIIFGGLSHWYGDK